MNQSETIEKLSEALVKLQGKLVVVKKSEEAKTPKYTYRYADLAAVWEMCRKPLSDNGLAVVQLCHNTEVGISLETILLHSSGQWISGEMAISAVNQDPQGIGSALTYARRYALCAILGIATEDDDGEAAIPREATNGVRHPSKPVPEKSPTPPISIPTCPVHHSAMNQGKKEGEWYCPRKLDDGSWCKERVSAKPPVDEHFEEDMGNISAGESMTLAEFKAEAKVLGYDTAKKVLDAWAQMGSQYVCEKLEQWAKLYTWEKGLELLREHKEMTNA